VLWATQDGCEESTRPQVVHATSRARGARRFIRDRVLHTSAPPGDLSPAGDLRIVALPHGAAAAWTSPTPRAGTVQAAIARGGTFGPVRELDTDGVFDHLAATTRGDLVVIWTRAASAPPPHSDGSTLRVLAAVRPAGRGFGAPELVSPPGGSGSAVATGAGRVIAAWTTASGKLEFSNRP
jgi:hypothetical protein